ncbi:MAG: histidinol-phosphatase [Agathobacter sp.]|uniref:histidinol-phosphatase n=1 Tax=Agathobacter sp. TaxID=2021311 RepID=UPI00258BFEB0|nr:histidinol-phosphatase [Agathobacter sp.]MCR5676592.1 histidinol-phosphatase [Agathobacter sp.]
MSDFLKANYHAHTYRCQHAVGTEREYIEAAIEMGEETFGFSDHIPCPFHDGYVSNIRMTMQQAPEYVQTLRKLAQEYKDDIRILIGFEAEYIPAFYNEQMQMVRDLGVDYLIMGQHFWTSENIGPYSGSPTKDEERIRLYVDSVIEGMQTGSYTYLAHPDLINYQGMDSVYEFEMERLCRAMLAMDIPLEVNLLGQSEKRHYPSDRFFEIASRVGNRVILGQDAHAPEHIKNRAVYEECMDLVQRHSLNLIHELKI